jgi:hypothetical protein
VSRRGRESWRRVIAEPSEWLLRSVDCGDLVGRAGLNRRPRLPSRAPCCLVVDEVAVDGVGQSAFQAAQGAFVALARGEFSGVVGAAALVVAFLGERGDV